MAVNIMVLYLARKSSCVILEDLKVFAGIAGHGEQKITMITLWNNIVSNSLSVLEFVCFSEVAWHQFFDLLR